MYHLTIFGILLTISLFFAAVTDMIFQVANAQFEFIENEIKDEDDTDFNKKHLDFTKTEKKDRNSNFLDEKVMETNSIDKNSFDPVYYDSYDYPVGPVICSDSGLVVDNYKDCPSQCFNGYFVMPGIECKDVGNPIQCEGTQIVVTDPRDCPQKCVGGYLDGFFVKEEPYCKMNPDKKNIHLQSCTTRLVVGDLSYCPVKCVTGQFDGMYVMDGRDCNWPKPNIKICDNGFVVDNFIASCPIKCVNGEFDGFYVVDIKECNNNSSYLGNMNQQNMYEDYMYEDYAMKIYV